MYIEVTFMKPSQEVKDLIIATLYEAEGFEESNDNLQAIFLKEKYNEEEIKDIASLLQVQFEIKEVAQQNWNALWESNFNPVIVGNFVGIRAIFHPPIQNVEHEIVITPKMSFGTGHHATTFLMMQQMRKIDFRNKSVFDFGTGTGVLAILAKKLGANNIVANDIDEWSIANAKENFETNNATNIELIQSDSGKLDVMFDIILANINRNVLLENIPTLAAQLKKAGILVLSGILEEDGSIITSTAANNQLTCVLQTQKDKWVCLEFQKQ